ncbi:hypothetical protein ACLB1G_18550 [Oxalobacteraceae bacterium A2-2]
MSIRPPSHPAVSLPRRICACVAVSLVCAGVAGGVQADPGDRQPLREAREAQRQQLQPVPRSAEVRSESRAADPRALDPRSFEARAEEQRKAMQEAASRNAEMGRRVGRMTPDERRDLRRQINEAGQDIYASPPRR